ncbi:MAG: MBL fold metallo-hydrolase [Candidatus Woesearchaeota archaeon]
MEIEGINIERLNHDCFKISKGSTVFYIDPFEIKDDEDAELILVTHEHHDHCSPPDLMKLSTEAKTTIVTIPDCLSKVAQVKAKDVKTMEPFQKIKLEHFEISTIPAYNINKFRSPGMPFHPKDDGKVGFIITFAGKRIYHAGDTDAIPEMKQLKNIDVALLPVSGIYVMTAEEAAEAARWINAKVTIPMHYGAIVGTKEDAERFAKLYKGKVQIL